MEMYEICCARCSFVFMIPKIAEEQFRNSEEPFYCPKGCSMSFGKKKNSSKSLLEVRLAVTRSSLSATKGVVTKLKKEIKRLKSI